MSATGSLGEPKDEEFALRQKMGFGRSAKKHSSLKLLLDVCLAWGLLLSFKFTLVFTFGSLWAPRDEERNLRYDKTWRAGLQKSRHLKMLFDVCLAWGSIS